MAKVLVTAHLGRHFRKFGHYDYKVLLNLGHEVHIAANFSDQADHFDDSNISIHQIDFNRNPFSFRNIEALRQLRKLLEAHQFDLIHTQSPSGGVITRLASKPFRSKGTKVIYTAHGFHFFKGAPLLNWLAYYSIEKSMSRITDCIITMNEEDYANAQRMHAPKVECIHGVGIDLSRFEPQTKQVKHALREKFGFVEDDFILFYAGELNDNKNQSLLIDVVNSVRLDIPNIRLLLAGTGKRSKQYSKMVEELQLKDHVIFLGYRNDISDLLKIADIAVSSSKREGLPLNVMEAMATGIPLVVTNCRGNRDLVKPGKNGECIEIHDKSGFAQAILRLFNNRDLYGKYSINNLRFVKNYALPNVEKEMKKIYRSFL